MSKTIEVRKKGCPKFSFFHQKKGFGALIWAPLFWDIPNCFGVVFWNLESSHSLLPRKILHGVQILLNAAREAHEQQSDQLEEDGRGTNECKPMEGLIQLQGTDFLEGVGSKILNVDDIWPWCRLWKNKVGKIPYPTWSLATEFLEVKDSMVRHSGMASLAPSFLDTRTLFTPSFFFFFRKSLFNSLMSRSEFTIWSTMDRAGSWDVP